MTCNGDQGRDPREGGVPAQMLRAHDVIGPSICFPGDDCHLQWNVATCTAQRMRDVPPISPRFPL
eukprot:28231-Eustigmatos_ZCMA.PRE.1